MIDFRSDTVTRPTAGMRRAMSEAEVGDDVYGEDPTVNRLEAFSAELLGKSSALFLPTGTMANLSAFLAQTRPGETVILSESSHPFHYENANIAMVAGLLTRTITDIFGKFTVEQVKEQIVTEDDPHLSLTTMVSIENTTNRGGGACWDFHEVESISSFCRRYNMRLHCDGARLFNACASTNIEPRFYAKCCDTLCFCLSKGLGAPAGSILAGDTETIHKARRFRKMLGGGMRQAGVLAAAGLYALEHHVSDLRDDHSRARWFRSALESEGIHFALPSPTNILYIQVENPYKITEALAQQGVLVLPHHTGRIRIVFHRDVGEESTRIAIEIFKKTLSATF
jgi:threonine aldolase